MSLPGGFDFSGARHVELIGVKLSGGRHSEVVECTLRIERESGRHEEQTVPFDENPPNLETLVALIGVINRRLGRS